jgi:hypothetical protein
MSENVFCEALAALGRALDSAGRPWMIIGGLAVIAHGVPRATIDIDATVSAGLVDVDALLAALSAEGITGRIPDAAGFAREHQVLLVEHRRTGVPLDVTLAWLPFEQEAIGHALRVPFAGMSLPVPRAEDLVIYKLVAARPRDVDDAERLLLLHADHVDLGRVRRLLEQFCQVLEDQSRLEQLDRLIARTKGPAG